mmetsp:Transcript_26233/g.54650  ORF Transcript_26233/g.54650 Transcript_26233/m.54650 type:complete len:212 (-) Transcript_26233:69-704(-)
MPTLPFKFSGYAVWLSVSEPSYVREVMDVFQTSLSLSRIPEPHVTFLYGAKFGSDSEASEAFRNVATAVGGALGEGEEVDRKLKPTGIIADIDGLMEMTWAEISLKASNGLTALQSEAKDTFFGASTSAVVTDDENDSDEDSKAPNMWRPHLSLAYDTISSSTGLTLDRVLTETGKRPGLVEERRITGMSLWDMHGLTVDEWRKVDEVMFE